MKKAIRRVAIFALILCCAAVLGISAWAADGDTFNAHLDIYTDEDTGIVTVMIPEENDSILAEKKPQLAIPCAFPYAKVTKGEEQVSSEMKDGSVVFTADSAGTYEISPADEVTFAVYSTDSACTASVANIVVDKAEGPYYEGEKITLTAPSKLGYVFNGWYPVTDVEGGLVKAYDSTRLSNQAVYTLVLNEDEPPVTRAITAVYQAMDQKADVKIYTVNGAKFRLGDSQTNQNGYSGKMALGSQLTIFASEPENVLQWQNSSNKLLGAGPDLTLTVTGDTTITLYYNTADTGQSFVQFVSDYGQVLSHRQYSRSDTEIEFPSDPTKFGYVFVGWVFENTTDTATSESILAKIGTQDIITVKPFYQRTNKNYEVVIAYMSEDGELDREPDIFTYSEGTSVTFRAPAIAEYIFDHWEDDSGNILSYMNDYYRMVNRDEILYAVYGVEEPEILPVIIISQASAVTGDVHKVSCTVTRSIPEDYSLLEHGILYARGVEGLDESNMGFYPLLPEGVGRYISNATMLSGVVKLNVKVSGTDYNEDTLVSFRGYMLLRNEATGAEDYYYTDVVKCSYNGLTAE